MAKKVVLETGKTFGEFCLLTNFTSKNCTLQNINLEANLGGLKLSHPFLSAAMTSVTGYEMALSLGKEGGLGVLPARLSIEEQVSIIEKIKGYEMGFVEDPITVRETATIDEVVRLVEKHGHSKVPIADRNNVFLGLFSFDRYLEANATPGDEATKIMIDLKDLPITKNPDISLEDAKKELSGKNYLIVLDDLGRLVKIAFKKDIENIPVAAAISTHEGWKERVQACVNAGVDMIVVDTSDGFNEYTSKVIEEFKNMKTKLPICVGNVITYDGARFLMENGADVIKVGMSSGGFIIEKDFEGFKIGKKEDKLGIRSSATCTLILDNCKVSKENVLGEVGKGFNARISAAIRCLSRRRPTLPPTSRKFYRFLTNTEASASAPSAVYRNICKAAEWALKKAGGG